MRPDAARTIAPTTSSQRPLFGPEAPTKGSICGVPLLIAPEAPPGVGPAGSWPRTMVEIGVTARSVGVPVVVGVAVTVSVAVGVAVLVGVMVGVPVVVGVGVMVGVAVSVGVAVHVASSVGVGRAVGSCPAAPPDSASAPAVATRHRSRLKARCTALKGRPMRYSVLLHSMRYFCRPFWQPRLVSKTMMADCACPASNTSICHRPATGSAPTWIT